MPSHHFNGVCCYLFQIIFQSYNNCLIAKLFQGVFCHDITKLLKLAQNDMVLFYFLKNVLLCPPNLFIHPPSLPTGDALAPPFLLVASMLAPPASVYAGLRHCRHCVCLTVQFKTFFLKCWQPGFQRRPVFWECSYTSRLSTIGVVVRHSVLYWYFTAKHTWMFTSEAPVAPCHQLVLLLVYMI